MTTARHRQMNELLKELTLHRHIGGLESWHTTSIAWLGLHRHIGGLEKNEEIQASEAMLHRHIGGLEN